MDPPSRDAVMLAINHLMELVKCCFTCRNDLFRAVVLCVLPDRSGCTAQGTATPYPLCRALMYPHCTEGALHIIHDAHGLYRLVLRDLLSGSKQTHDPAFKFPAGVDLTPYPCCLPSFPVRGGSVRSWRQMRHTGEVPCMSLFP